MKYILIVFIWLANPCFGQRWQAELMAGITGYNGDLTYTNISFRTIGPAANLNLKYLLPNKYLVLRAGVAYGTISASDKNNHQAGSFDRRNLNFKTGILEGSVCMEFNLSDPDYYIAYPYLFAGAGFFHFNPYTNDKDGKKVYLQPLGTEGQGLNEYPNRKMYSLTQFCIPVGGGWKWVINDRYEVMYELGARILFTDYLDDVSTTYADPQLLLNARGEKAVELAYRGGNPANAITGKKRGNSKVKDWYYMTGIKLVVNLGE